MALIISLVEGFKDRQSIHGTTDSTFYIVTNAKGEKYLQIDTYGSSDRQIPGKISQSVQFSPNAIAELKLILEKHFK